MLRGRGRLRSGERAGRVLLAAQFALAIAFTGSTVVMVQQYRLLTHRRLGFDREQVVVVRGERRPTERAHGTFLCVERSAGPFERAIELPDEPDPEGGSATYADGLLTLEIPRRPATRRRTIPIRPARGPEKG